MRITVQQNSQFFRQRRSIRGALTRRHALQIQIQRRARVVLVVTSFQEVPHGELRGGSLQWILRLLNGGGRGGFAGKQTT